MSAERGAYIVTGDVGGQAAGDQRQVLRQRAFHPRAFVQGSGPLSGMSEPGRERRSYCWPVISCSRYCAVASGSSRQSPAAAAVSCPGLGILSVGDGDQAHFEALVGLVELAWVIASNAAVLASTPASAESTRKYAVATRRIRSCSAAW